MWWAALAFSSGGVPLGPRRLSLRCREKTRQKQLHREFSYIAAANKDLLASPVCQVQQPTGDTFVHGTPDAALLSMLAVLRRPPTG